MKSSAWDNKLWQNKMQEIPLDGDVDFAWGKMQGLLDKVMPVTPAAPVVKAPWSLPKSWLLTIAYTAAAAAILFFATHFLLKKQHQKAIKHNKENFRPVHSRADSVKQVENRNDSTIDNQPTSGRVTADSLNAGNLSAKSNINTTTVNSNSKKAAADHAVNSSSKRRGALVRSRSTTSRSSLKYTNNTSVFKGRNGAVNRTSQTQNMAALSTASAILKGSGNHRFGNRNGARVNNSGSRSPGTISYANNGGQAGNKNMPADVNASKTNGLVKPDSTSSAQKTNNPTSNTSTVQLSKADSAKAAANKLDPATKPIIAGNAASVKNKPFSQTKAKNAKQQTYSKFDVAIEAGINSGKGSTTPYAGVSGSYAINSKFSVGIGANLFSSRTIAGKYSIGKYQYNTQDDSGHTTSHTAKKLLVSTSQKINTLEIPLTANYKLTKWLSVKGGAVISMPIKTGTIQNTLAPVGNPLDTARAFKTLSSAVNSTTILNKVNFNITGGVLINISRVYFDAGYVQGVRPYTISSSLGSSNVYYHYLQLGIGYKLFRSKPKSNK